MVILYKNMKEIARVLKLYYTHCYNKFMNQELYVNKCMIDGISIRQELFDYLKKNPMNRRQLAELLEISHPTLMRLMEGEPMREETWFKVLKFLNMNENAA